MEHSPAMRKLKQISRVLHHDCRSSHQRLYFSQIHLLEAPTDRMTVFLGGPLVEVT